MEATGYNKEQVHRILVGNLLRLLRQAKQRAARYKK
jgi:hypothetical protein